MTASAPRAPRPGRAANADRPVGALLALLMVGLLTMLASAGHAQAVTAGSGFTPPPVTTQAGPASSPSDTADHRAARTAGAPRADRATRADRDEPGQPVRPVRPVQRTDGKRPRTWCSADGDTPPQHNGCSSHPYCAQDAQLPNPPPQRLPVTLPRPVTVRALPRGTPVATPPGPHLAPDLHELQVQRS